MAVTSTRITTPFSALSTADDVGAGIDLTGNRVIVTGGASGIGVATATALAKLGATVTLAVRNISVGWDVARRVAAQTGNEKLDVRELELTDPRSVARFIQSWDKPLHLLINNAGVMAVQDKTLHSTWESQFATNHLGHFALATGLHSALASANGSRVVSVSSSAHLFSPVVFDDINFNFRPYDPRLAYGQSKTAVILFGVGARRRWEGDGITVNTLNPGEGATTTVLLATSPLVEGISGRYFNDNQEAEVTDHRPEDLAIFSTRVASYALDEDNADRLWNISHAAIS